ncbi:MAG: DUF4440 domain-containing protein [Pseudomonadota bacterium]
MSKTAITAVDQLGKAIRDRDVALLQTLYADDIAVWHASTNAEQDKSQNIGLLDAVFAVTSELEYINIRRQPIEGGVVQQHSLVGRFTDGTEMPALHACLFIWVRDGQITRIEEYFDSAAFAELGARLAANAAS